MSYSQKVFISQQSKYFTSGVSQNIYGSQINSSKYQKFKKVDNFKNNLSQKQLLHQQKNNYQNEQRSFRNSQSSTDKESKKLHSVETKDNSSKSHELFQNGFQVKNQQDEYYQGNTLNGMKHGQGLCIRQNKTKYQGNWAQDQKNGYGVFQNLQTGQNYSGLWKNDLYDGWGKLKLENGDMYIGNFQLGKFEGNGKYISKSGEILNGNWHKGMLMQQFNKGINLKSRRQSLVIMHNKINQLTSNQNKKEMQKMIKRILQTNIELIQDYTIEEKININFINRENFLQKLNLLLQNKLNTEQILDFIRINIRGRYNLIQTVFGHKLRLYADFTASGQDIILVDEMISYIQEMYSNTHTESSHDGKVMNKIYHDAQKIILESCNVNKKDYSVISVGSGCTGAIELAQKILGTYIAPKTMQRIENIIQIEELKQKLRIQKKLPLILITSYEHHSNEITWKKQLCDVKVIPLTEDGYFDIQQLEQILQQNINKYNDIICSFSAGSNVTGIKTDIQKIIKVIQKYKQIQQNMDIQDDNKILTAMQQYKNSSSNVNLQKDENEKMDIQENDDNNIYLFFDYAGVAPYVKIDLQNIDGIYLSPHKFLGGPGSCGILIIKNNIYDKQLSPTHGGGGTVQFVNDNIIVYDDNIMNREQSGTPGILQMIKAALSFKVKELLVDIIHEKEQNMLQQFFDKFKNNQNFIILGPQDYYNRVSILSFTIRHKDRILHSNFLVKLLSDLFGIQARSGCSCAGPYGHKLLNINETISLELLKWIKGSDNEQQNFEGVKFGWGRVNLHYSFQQQDIEYIMNALEFISLYGYKFLIFYYFDIQTGEWIHINELGIQCDYKLEFDMLLKNKKYANGEQYREKLMQQHLLEAKLIANSIQEFEYDKFEQLGDIAYFYAAKNHVLDEERLNIKKQDICNGTCSIKKFIKNQNKQIQINFTQQQNNKYIQQINYKKNNLKYSFIYLYIINYNIKFMNNKNNNEQQNINDFDTKIQNIKQEEQQQQQKNELKNSNYIYKQIQNKNEQKQTEENNNNKIEKKKMRNETQEQQQNIITNNTYNITQQQRQQLQQNIRSNIQQQNLKLQQQHISNILQQNVTQQIQQQQLQNNKIKIQENNFIQTLLQPQQIQQQQQQNIYQQHQQLQLQQQQEQNKQKNIKKKKYHCKNFHILGFCSEPSECMQVNKISTQRF